MANPNETRKLAAVMFADIEGYTTLFQRNENAAIRQVEDHRKDLEEITSAHQGHIIQFYGDGSVTMFDSIIDAIQCAVQLQQTSTQHRIPLRIGLHMGDLIFKGGDIFGDAVNITSRIQTFGVAGSIIVSRKVVDELGNHPEFQTQRLGAYALKGVRNKIELYALTGHGLNVPLIAPQLEEHNRRKTSYFLFFFMLAAGIAYLGINHFKKIKPVKLENQPIIIPPFNNFTQQSNLDGIADLASSYITKVMSETSTADVVSYESAMLYTNRDIASITNNPIKARKLGAAYMVQGNYNLIGSKQDSLRLYATILDLNTMHPVKVAIPEVTCSLTEPIKGIEKMADILKGYWRSREYGFFHPPNDKALTAYLKAVAIWADPEKEEDAKQYLRQSISLDTLFLDAYMLLLDAMNADAEFDQEADTILLIKKRFADLGPKHQNLLAYYESDLAGEKVNAYNYLIKAEGRPIKELFYNSTAMVMAMEYLNDPVTAVSLNDELNSDSMDLNVCVYCNTRVNMAMQAYLALNQLDKAGKLADRMKKTAKRSAQFSSLIHYYISRKDTIAVNDIIRRAMEIDTLPDTKPFYCLDAAIAARLQDKADLQKYYGEYAVAYYRGLDPLARDFARSYMLAGNTAQAKKIYEAKVKKKDVRRENFAELGIIYAKEGNVSKANEMISQLNALKKPEYDNGWTAYWQGRIKANLGADAEAIRLLQISLEEGMKFTASTFQQDPDLMVLKDNKAYQTLLTQYRIRE